MSELECARELRQLAAMLVNEDTAGAVYVFERLVDTAGETRARRRRPPESFGASVAMAADGTTALIGALGDEDPNGEHAGSAYVFKRADGSWTQQAKLASADGDSYDFFGRSVAVAADSTTVLVGAVLD